MTDATPDPVARTSPRPRITWIDTTRALAVLAVVLFHVSRWHYVDLVDQPGADRAAVGIGNIWEKLNGVANGLRMPVLLGLSGLLMARKISEDVRPTLRSAASNGWLYLVWLTVYAAVSPLLVHGAPHRIESFGQYLHQVILPETPLWYLMALATYTLVMLAVRRVPTAVVLVGLGLLSVAVDHLVSPDATLWRKVAMLAVYFAVGVRLGSLIRQVAAHTSALLAAGAVMITFAMVYADRWVEVPYGYEAFGLVRNVVVIFAAVICVAWAVRWKPLGRLGAWVGQRTLSIYVMHVLVLQSLVSVWLAHPSVFAFAVSSRWVAVAYPPLLALAVTATCLGLGVVLRRLHADFLFELPFRRARRTHVPSAAPRPSA